MTSTSERWLAFLDADVLAHPRSRSLVLFGSRHPDTRYAARWSPQVEAEADRALAEQDAARQRRPEQTGGRRRPILVSALRGSPSTTDWSDWVLVPDASEDAMATLVDTAPGNRHVAAAAHACGARLIVSQNVSDYGWQDLERLNLVVVHPDLFLARVLTRSAYLAILESLAGHSTGDLAAPATIHASLGRTHPLLTAAMHEAFPDVTPVAAEASPREVFRGYRCLVCGRRLTDPAALRTGVGPECGLA